MDDVIELCRKSLCASATKRGPDPPYTCPWLSGLMTDNAFMQELGNIKALRHVQRSCKVAQPVAAWCWFRLSTKDPQLFGRYHFGVVVHHKVTYHSKTMRSLESLGAVWVLFFPLYLFGCFASCLFRSASESELAALAFKWPPCSNLFQV